MAKPGCLSEPTAAPAHRGRASVAVATTTATTKTTTKTVG